MAAEEPGAEALEAEEPAAEALEGEEPAAEDPEVEALEVQEPAAVGDTIAPFKTGRPSRRLRVMTLRPALQARYGIESIIGVFGVTAAF